LVKAPRGYRHRTRKVLKKDVREKGAVPPLGKLLIEYRQGDRVYIVPNPAIHGGMPHRRYIGKVGIIVGKRGRAYIVEVEVGHQKKHLIVYPEHLEPAFSVEERVREYVEKLSQLIKASKQLRLEMFKAIRAVQLTAS